MTQQTVLVVDDEPHILSFLEDNLRADDFTVHTASSIAQARSRLNAVRPSLVVLDISLPDATGFELCREIRGHDPVTARFDVDVPIIMLTARGEDVDRVRGFERGADDYVVKQMPSLFPYVSSRLDQVFLDINDVLAHGDILRRLSYPNSLSGIDRSR
ncbi:MAG: response regulator [Thermoleophilia bacterium]|nr:response regulator [Thermoleophilia bacterium]